VPVWTAEVDVDAALARRLIEAQFPDVDLSGLRLLGDGFDMTVFTTGIHVFRFPRREVVLPGFARETAAVPLLAPLLPLPVPVPVFRGKPSRDHPWPFAGYVLLPGAEISELRPSPVARAALARPLAGFLRRLHSPMALEAVRSVDLPVDPQGRGDMSVRVPRARAQLEVLARLGLWDLAPETERLLSEAARLDPARDVCVVHGDLHLRHLLIDRGRPSAVIDWIDISLAPRSVDLVLYWSLLPPEARPAFIEAYGTVSEAELLRARVLSLFLCGALAEYAHHVGSSDLRREAVAGLDLTVTE
jgi:aminoglycoside phosphotransferase (APT) family kinase protein